MAFIITVSSKSGGGKSAVFDYLNKMYSEIYPMLTYTSRPKRIENEGGYVFKDKQYFIEHKTEFVELATYPPHSDPKEDDVHYYGKHLSQFDGKNYVMAMDEVGVLTLRKLHQKNKLFGYDLITLFIEVDDEIRLARIGHDSARDARDAKRNYLPNSEYTCVLDNNGTLEQLYAQVDEIVKKYF